MQLQPLILRQLTIQILCFAPLWQETLTVHSDGLLPILAAMVHYSQKCFQVKRL